MLFHNELDGVKSSKYYFKMIKFITNNALHSD